MQTTLRDVKRRPTLGTLATELYHMLDDALPQLSPEAAANELLPILLSAYSLSKKLYSALAISGGTPGMPAYPAEDDPNSDESAEEDYKAANTAFCDMAPDDDLGAANTSVDDDDDDDGILHPILPSPTAKEAVPLKGKSRQILPDARTSALARGARKHKRGDDSGLEDHSFYDMAALTSSDTNTIDKFITSCFENIPIPSDLSNGSAGARPVREVERAIREEDRVTEMVYAPSMGDVFHRCMDKVGGDDLTLKELTDELREVLTSGPRLANLCREFHSEGDVEYVFRASHLTIVAEIINYVEDRKDDDRLYPFRGAIVSGNDNIPGPYHAFADLELENCPCEIKKPTSIGPRYISTLLDISPNMLRQLEQKMKNGKVFGATYNFSWPAEETAKLSKETQPLVQIYTQLIEKGSHFGIASSHDFTFFVIRDPQHLRRLYISRLYSTYRTERTTPTDSALYTLYKFLRVACNPNLHEKFFKIFREEALNITPAAAGSPVFAKDGCVDVGPESLTATAIEEMKAEAAVNKEIKEKKLRATTLADTVHYKDHSTSVATDESSLDNHAPPSIAVNARATELPARARPGREKTTGFYKDPDTSAGTDESLLTLNDPAPPKAVSNRPSGQRKPTPTAPPQIEVAPPTRRTTKATQPHGPPAEAARKGNTKGGRQ